MEGLANGAAPGPRRTRPATPAGSRSRAGASRADLQRYARPRRFGGYEAQPTEQPLIARVGGRGVVERALDLDPLDGVARHAVLGGEGIDVLLVRAVDAGAEEPGAVGPHDLARHQEHVDLAHRRLRHEVDAPDRASLAAPLRIHAD